MRRPVLFIVLVAALLPVGAAAQLQPIRLPHLGERTLPRVRRGVIRIPPGHASGRVTVIVDLRLPPLAAARGSGLLAFSAQRRLSTTSRSSRAYLARLAHEQVRAAAQIRRAIPQARIQNRYRIVLDAFALRLPYRDLPRLARLQAIQRIYPSLGYHLDTNKSPQVIHADQFWANTGGMGQGIKIGVVDDGIDQTNPFFNPAGFTYPAGFPKGQTRFTTPKVIVARAFPGPGSGKQGRLPLYRLDSFHGTHVAGIAAGVQGTVAVAGPDHPTVTGLSGIAPRAWLGNYRVFNTPVPTGGDDAFTPQIVAAFESAVNDGMDVINFSGGGPEVNPTSDALIEATDNVAAAGVVPVISAGNDRDDFGLGSVGSPSNAPDAISVAAVSNLHVFGPELNVTAAGAPAETQHIPFAFNAQVPPSWPQFDHILVDVGTITGRDGHPVDRHLCAASGDPNDPSVNPLPAGSLGGVVALVSRGGCTFISKSERVREAGGTGMVLVDNRSGEANFIPVLLSVGGGMISDLDGANLRAYLDAHGGRTTFRATPTNNPLEIQTGRSGIVTSFSSAGPTNFTHALKPDLAAPGGQVLSSTLREFAGSQFAVFDGTSMAAPHVSGAAALLLQQHPGWTPQQVKSALMTTAGPAWADTARTQEASVLLEGGGLVNVMAADDPKLFADPASLSFGLLDASRPGGPRKPLLVSLSDSGDGTGTWTVSVEAQAASTGASVTPGASPVTVAPGGTVDVPVVAAAAAGASRGDDYGFVVFQRGTDRIRIPYDFTVSQPQIGKAPRVAIKRNQTGSTQDGTDFVDVYRFPAFPFGPPKDYAGPAGMNEDGAEHVYTLHVNGHVANAGAAVVASSFGSLVEPWLLGSLNEDDVQGYPGTPVNVNGLTYEYQFDNGATATDFPPEGRYYVVVDSRADPFTDEPLRGAYRLHYWQNDVTPPRFRFLTRRVPAGRPVLAAIATDRGAGVDPLSLVIGYRQALVLAALYDPSSGLVVWLLDGAPKLKRGKTALTAIASDYQESKNVDQAGENILPNTAFRRLKLRAVTGPVVTWLLPRPRACVRGATGLVVAGGSSHGVRSVAFFAGRRRISKQPGSTLGIYGATWHARKARRGRHVLRVVLTDRKGRRAQARQVVRVCRR